MILSIDRVLQLLAEGKAISKIAELADCNEDDVSKIIIDARTIINKYEKPKSRKKIIIKKASTQGSAGENEIGDDIKILFKGSELSAIPVESQMIMYIDGITDKDKDSAGIGIVIYDRDNRQIGKLSQFTKRESALNTLSIALLKALKIGEYFRTKSLKIRTDSRQLLKAIAGDIEVKDDLRKIYDQIFETKKKFEDIKFEHVTKMSNEKANHLAKAGSSLKDHFSSNS